MSIPANIGRFVEEMIGRSKRSVIRNLSIQISNGGAAAALVRANRLPLASVVFLTPVLTYDFSAASADWSLYVFDNTGDSVAYGEVDGATITATPKPIMVPDPEFTGLELDAKTIDARNIQFTKIIPPAYASAPDISYIGLKDGPVSEWSYSNFRPGELLISLDADGGNTRIKVENSDHYGSTPLLDWTSTGVARATGIDLLVTNDNGTLTVKYRAYGGGAWTTACTDTYQTNIQMLSWAVQKHNYGDEDNTMSILSIVADGTDAVNAYNGFIPSISYNGLNKDGVYVKLADGSWLEIVPVVNDIVLDITSGLLYQWNGTAWVVYTHAISGSMHTGVPGAVLDNFFSVDANQLPKDSGTNLAAIVVAYTLLVTNLQKYILALLSGLNLGAIPGSPKLQKYILALLSGLNLGAIPGSPKLRTFSQNAKPLYTDLFDGEEAWWIDTDDANALYSIRRQGTDVKCVKYTA